jgi:hypothetical protein
MVMRNRIASDVLELILYLSVTPTKISVPLSCFRTIDRSRRRLRAPARRTSFCYDDVDVSRCRPAATATAAEAGRPGSIGAGPCRALVGPCHTSRAVAASGLRRWLNSDGHLGRAAGSARVICSQDMDAWIATRRVILYILPGCQSVSISLGAPRFLWPVCYFTYESRRAGAFFFFMRWGCECDRVERVLRARTSAEVSNSADAGCSVRPAAASGLV